MDSNNRTQEIDYDASFFASEAVPGLFELPKKPVSSEKTQYIEKIGSKDVFGTPKASKGITGSDYRSAIPRPKPANIPTPSRTSTTKLPAKTSAAKSLVRTSKPPVKNQDRSTQETFKLSARVNAKIAEEKKRVALKKRAKRQREQVRTFSHVFGSVLLAVFVVTISAFLAQFIVRALLDYTGITVTEFEVTIEIPPQASTAEIAELLAEHDIIAMPSVFVYYSRSKDKDGGYLSGLFSLSSTMSYSQIVNTLQNRPQSTETVVVNIPEGLTAREIGMLLEENLVCRAEDFMEFYKNLMGAYRFERRLEHNALKFNQLEGDLFPETHEFFIVNGLADDPTMDTTKFAKIAAQTLLSHYNAQITDEMYRRMFDRGLLLDEFMTIASMVQWEAATQEDMLKVASVFLNRFWNPDRFPYMQSDVTEKYANNNIAPYRRGEDPVYFETLMTAYNTYETPGLPPGPICNPGMMAMLAVLDAPKTDYFYFCANVETGEIFYATNLADHERNEVLAGIR